MIPSVRIVGVKADISISSNGLIKYEKNGLITIPYSHTASVRFDEVLEDVVLRRAESLFNGRSSNDCKIEATIQYEVDGVIKNHWVTKQLYLIWREIGIPVGKSKPTYSDQDRTAILTDWFSKKPHQRITLINYSDTDKELNLDDGDTKRLIVPVISSNFSSYIVDNRGEAVITLKYVQPTIRRSKPIDLFGQF